MSSMSVIKPSVFRPGQYLENGALLRGAELNTPDLLILNQPMADFDIFSRLWKSSRYRLCADGGANRLYDMFEQMREAQRGDFLPSSIHGDLDSLRPDVRDYYAARGVEISQDCDQYSTDFGKAMKKIAANHASNSPREVLILGTLAGRVDQGLGLLHEMYREETHDPMLRQWLFSETNISFVLRATHNVIDGVKSSGFFTENAGLLPVYGPATITTSGLEWDVKDWDTRMGCQVSTSNHVVSDTVRVHTDAPLLFTIERAPSKIKAN